MFYCWISLWRAVQQQVCGPARWVSDVLEGFLHLLPQSWWSPTGTRSGRSGSWSRSCPAGRSWWTASPVSRPPFTTSLPLRWFDVQRESLHAVVLLRNERPGLRQPDPGCAEGSHGALPDEVPRGKPSRHSGWMKSQCNRTRYANRKGCKFLFYFFFTDRRSVRFIFIFSFTIQ